MIGNDLIERLDAEAKIWPRSDISGLLKEASAAIVALTKANTVSDEMVEAACKAAYVVPTDFARKDMRAALTAALQAAAAPGGPTHEESK
jgi:hypothetical protein